MTGTIAITDYGWYEFLLSQPNLDKVNFWTLSSFHAYRGPTGAPYSDEWDKKTGTLIYKGHDVHRTQSCPDPKAVDQPMTPPNGSWTENGKFLRK